MELLFHGVSLLHLNQGLVKALPRVQVSSAIRTDKTLRRLEDKVIKTSNNIRHLLRWFLLKAKHQTRQQLSNTFLSFWLVDLQEPSSASSGTQHPLMAHQANKVAKEVVRVRR